MQVGHREPPQAVEVVAAARRHARPAPRSARAEVRAARPRDGSPARAAAGSRRRTRGRAGWPARSPASGPGEVRRARCGAMSPPPQPCRRSRSIRRRSAGSSHGGFASSSRCRAAAISVHLRRGRTGQHHRAAVRPDRAVRHGARLDLQSAHAERGGALRAAEPRTGADPRVALGDDRTADPAAAPDDRGRGRSPRSRPPPRRRRARDRRGS